MNHTKQTIHRTDLIRARLRGTRDGAPLAGAGRARTFKDRRKEASRRACRGGGVSHDG